MNTQIVSVIYLFDVQLNALFYLPGELTTVLNEQHFNFPRNDRVVNLILDFCLSEAWMSVNLQFVILVHFVLQNVWNSNS